MTNLIELAREIATQAHEGQTRIGGQPYIEHPRRVAAAVELDGFGDEHVQAAWLHDVVEDSLTTLADLLASGFSPEVVAAIDSVTRRPGEEYLDMVHRAAADQIGVVVRWHDNADNSRWRDSMEHLKPDRRERMGLRYALARVILQPAYESARATLAEVTQ